MKRAALWLVCGALAAGPAGAQELDWEVAERAEAPAPVLAARNVRDGALGLADAFFDANTAVFGAFALGASQLFMGAGDLVGLADDNAATERVTKAVLSKNLAKVAYLWHLAGAESLLGTHGLEVERWAAHDAAALNPLLAGEDVEQQSGPLPLDPLVFAEEGLLHADAYQPAAPFAVLGAAVIVDGALRPAASLLRIAQLPGPADALDARGAEWFRRAVEWGW
jgi:hypothetical protein